MGRPLNDRFFGKRNIGGVGGQGLASVSTAVQGSININNNYPNFPTLTVAAPTTAGGVTAVTAVTWEVDTVSLAGGTGYTTGTIVSITGLDQYAATPTKFTVTQAGGTPTFNAFTDRGSYTSINATGISTWAIVGPGGTGAQATITFRVKSIAVATVGSGYTSAPSLSWTTLSGTTPSAQTPALTTFDLNLQNPSQNPLGTIAPAIVIYANVAGGGAVAGDIIKQVGSRRYKVTTAAGTARVNLVASNSPAAGQAYIVATDSDSNTYWVTKLTAHRATLTPRTLVGSAYQFPLVDNGLGSTEPVSAGWTFSTPIANNTVTIANA